MASFYPRDVVLAWVLAIALCLYVTTRCSVEGVGRIELVFGMEASFDQFYTVFKGNSGIYKKWYVPLEHFRT